MIKITLQMETPDGTIEKSNDIVLQDEDTLIMQFPEGMRDDHAYHAYKSLAQGLEHGGIIGLPNTISFKIIRKIKVAQ